jgi:putative ABC transport system permease protein
MTMNELSVIFRKLVRAPLVSVAAVLTIAVAIAGTAAVFALLDSVVLRALPYHEPNRLVAVWVDITELADEVGIQDPQREWTGLANHRDVRATSRTLDDVAAFSQWTPSFRADDGMQRVPAAAVTWNGLQLLGVTPVLGRTFSEAEGDSASACTVVIGERFWHRHFAADPGVIGRELVFTGETCIVVGVLPASFRFPFVPAAEIISPLRSEGDDRGAAYLRQFGRLADGATLELAQAEFDTIAANLRAEYPQANRGQGLFIEPLQESLNRGVREQLVTLQAAAAFVLVVALANLASLMVARVLGRAGEFSVRSALGAGRWRQFRLLWVEGLVLATVGGIGGVMLAVWGVEALARAFPPGFNDAWDVRVGGATILVAALGALLAAGVMAVVSFITLLRGQGSVPGGARVAGYRGGRRLSATLVASNFAIALAVAVTGLLLLQSYQRLADVDPGFSTEGVLAGMIQLPSAQFSDNYPDADALRGAYDRLVAHVAGIPGVDRVGLGSTVPFGQGNEDMFVAVEGRPTAREDGRAHVWLTRADEGYFDTMGIRMREGRGFQVTDRGADRRVAVVNAAFAREYLGGTEVATGVRVGTGPVAETTWWDIVGVVDDVRGSNLARPQTPALYQPAWSVPVPGMYVVLQTERDTLAMLPDLRRALAAFDPDLALTDVIPMRERVDAQLMVPRTVSGLTLLFALTALLLAAIGVYGTLAQSVVQRKREFGVRRALGAQDRDVMMSVMRQGVGPVLIGLVLGVPLAILLGRRLSEILYTVTPAEPRAWALAFAALLAIALIASFLPGRRAVRVAPMEALRDE